MQVVDKSAEADLRSTKTLFEMMKGGRAEGRCRSPVGAGQIDAGGRGGRRSVRRAIARQIAAGAAEAAAAADPSR